MVLESSEIHTEEAFRRLLFVMSWQSQESGDRDEGGKKRETKKLPL